MIITLWWAFCQGAFVLFPFTLTFLDNFNNVNRTNTIKITITVNVNTLKSCRLVCEKLIQLRKFNFEIFNFTSVSNRNIVYTIINDVIK